MTQTASDKHGAVHLQQDRKDNPMVFPGTGHDGCTTAEWGAWNEAQKRAKLLGVRIHDLRHSFASFGAGAGDSLLVIGALLGHKDPSTTARYAHLANDPLRAAADRIAGNIAAALTGEEEYAGNSGCRCAGCHPAPGHRAGRP